jgi:hypothetical protein
MVLFLFGLITMSIFAPERLNRLTGVVEAKPGQAERPVGERRSLAEPAPRSKLPPAAPVAAVALRPAGGRFGRTRV